MVDYATATPGRTDLAQHGRTNARIMDTSRHEKEAAVKIKSPVVVATLTIVSAAVALATRKPAEIVQPESRAPEALAEQDAWFI